MMFSRARNAFASCGEGEVIRFRSLPIGRSRKCVDEGGLSTRCARFNANLQSMMNHPKQQCRETRCFCRLLTAEIGAHMKSGEKIKCHGGKVNLATDNIVAWVSSEAIKSFFFLGAYLRVRERHAQF
jgi:hypothetical protein